MPKRDIIVVGGSAGAPAALHRLVAALPSDLTASVFIVTHVPVHGAMMLAGLLAAQTDLPVSYAEDEAPIQAGHIVIGPPDRHLLLTPHGVRLGAGPRENMSRPSIDPLFRSAAAAFGGRVVGVVLTGMLNDGAAGLRAIKQCGGATVVQDPLEAFAPDMPRAAIQAAAPDHVVRLDDIAALLASLCREEAPLGRAASPQLALEIDIALGDRLGSERLKTIAAPSTFSCPNCDGVLSEIKGEGALRYRCQTGHAVTAETLADFQERNLESALGVALRIIEERIALIGRLAEDARVQGNAASAELHEARAGGYLEQAEVLRRALLGALKIRQAPA